MAGPSTNVPTYCTDAVANQHTMCYAPAPAYQGINYESIAAAATICYILPLPLVTTTTYYHHHHSCNTIPLPSMPRYYYYYHYGFLASILCSTSLLLYVYIRPTIRFLRKEIKYQNINIKESGNQIKDSRAGVSRLASWYSFDEMRLMRLM